MGEASSVYFEQYTVADWENWNDPWELIYGFPYCMSPAPSFRQQATNTEILVELVAQLKSYEKCKAIMPIDWQINEQTVVQPDILVLCRPVTGKRLFQVPICLFEIISPSTQRKDETIKFELYQNQGVKYYIMVNPETELIQAFTLGNDGKYAAMPIIPKLVFDFEGCKVELDVARIWASI